VFAAHAAVAALYARDARGAEGQVVDASITDACLAITESVTSIVRAGASIVVTYAAADMAGWLREA